MSNNENKSSLSGIEISLHWIVALGMIALITVGFYMSNTETYSLYPIHKSLGVLILIFVLIRAIVRIKKGWPESVSNSPNWQRIASRFTHWFLLLGTIVMPISGMMSSIMSGRGLSIFDWKVIAPNLGEDGKREVINKQLASLGGEVHEVLGLALAIVIGLHVLAALKHHFIDRDRTLTRMFGK